MPLLPQVISHRSVIRRDVVGRPCVLSQMSSDGITYACSADGRIAVGESARSSSLVETANQSFLARPKAAANPVS